MKKLILNELCDEYNLVGNQRNYPICPFCGDEGSHFFINEETGGYDCKKCGVAGYASDKKALFLCGASPQKSQAPISWHEIKLPPNHALSPKALEYLEAREIPEYFAKSLGLCEWTNTGRILIPYFNEDGALIYYNSRAYLDGVEPKYITSSGKHPLYVPVRGFAATWTGVIVEGPFDALAVARAGYFAVALGGKNLSKHLENELHKLMSEREKIVICFDGDALAEAIKLQTKLGYGEIACCDYGDDPASISRDELRRLIG